ncbi:MAG TPA: hypothetical protein VMT35_06470 [Ignavibacteriaceae bacterium]|nr:hypothetical protein [Ignavibacteriaceae bacterium]
MLILVAENPQSNSYTSSLLNAYQSIGHTVVCDPHNFFYSNLIPEILHIHWPERLYHWYPLSEKPDNLKIDLLREKLCHYKNKGTVIVFTVHDLILHFSTNRKLDEKIFNLIIEHSDIISHHCSKSLEMFSKLYPIALSKVNIIDHHGDYLIDYKYITKKEARSKLNISDEKFVILNFGSQQSYKGREFIDKVFNSCAINSKYLITAGNYYYRGLSLIKKFVMEIRNNMKEKNNFRNKKYIYRSIDNNEIPVLFNASDIVLLGHKAGLVSGIIPMAATFSKPVIYPDIGCFKEQMKDWIGSAYEAGNLKQACDSLNDIYKKMKDDKLFLDNSIWMQKNSWNKHVELILQTVNKFKN